MAHPIVVRTSQRLLDGTCYDASRDARHDASQAAWEKPRALAALERLGDNVPLAPVT